MMLPRWTAWPALGLIFATILVGVPKPGADPSAGAAAGEPAESETTPYPMVAVLGIDGLDPEILREAIERFPDRMENFARLAADGGIHSLATSTPPQSPVAWSNFITGRDPGGHGVYDFIHRDPVTRLPVVGTAVTTPFDPIALWGDWQLPRGGESSSNRSGEAFWTILAERGVPADVWRMPANFPVEPSKGIAISGMMTPAIDAAYGAATLYTTDPPADAGIGEARIVTVSEYDGRIDTRIAGPDNVFKKGEPATATPLVIHIDREAGAVALDVESAVLILEPGQWSDFVSISYSLLPLHAMDMAGTVRFYLRSIDPVFELYASPVNIDPSSPVSPVSEPESESAKLADRRDGIGPYYTQGMPEDVGALKDGILGDEEFMQQAELVHDEGERMMDYAIARYLERGEGGLLFFYYSTIDLCSHMMWRHSDEAHPHHDPEFAARDSSRWSGREGSTWKDVVIDLYLEMDPVLGRLRSKLGEGATLIVMSDHGFAPYHRKFDLNAWLVQEGYLVLKEDVDATTGHPTIFSSVDWSKSRAYGMGFNGLYLNLAGRERDNEATDENESGIVRPGAEADALLAELATKLEAIGDPERGGARVVLRADLARDVYSGDRLAEAPDIIVGYDAGYGNSDEASQGYIGQHVLEDNLGGTFNGSHLMAPEVVAGSLLSNRPVAPGAHALEDLTVEVLRQFDIDPLPGMDGHPVLADR